jgi:hypothetical protein
LIDEAGLPQGVAPMPETDLEIRWTILFHNPFYHSTVAFRRSCFEAAGRYKIDELVSQDHYLWFHMLPFCRARNIWKNPMTDAEVEEKFRSLARRQLPAAQTDNLLGRLWALDSLPQAGELIAMTRI